MPLTPTTTTAPPRPALGLSLPQVAGSALASLTAAVAASFLGVAGTLIGAVVGSLVATIGSAFYAHSLRSAGARIRVVRPAAGSDAPTPAPVLSDEEASDEVASDEAASDEAAFDTFSVTRRRRLRLAGGLVLGVVIALGAVTGIESVLGHPISDSTSSGTSIGDAVTGSGGSSTPVSPVSPSVPVVPTTGTGSATPTETTTPTDTPTVTSTTTDPATQSPSATSSATSTPLSTPATTAPGAAPTTKATAPPLAAATDVPAP